MQIESSESLHVDRLQRTDLSRKEKGDLWCRVCKKYRATTSQWRLLENRQGDVWRVTFCTRCDNQLKEEYIA
jgi:hypothetical protein